MSLEEQAQVQERFGQQQVLVVDDHNMGYVRLTVTNAAGNQVAILSTLRIYVIDSVDGQLFFLNNISGHYHTGDNINLGVTATPPLQAGDEIVWEWKWAGADWTPLPGATGLSHTLVGEQALSGVQVRATLVYADEAKESVVTDPKTIGVDDHGAGPRQRPTIGGETSVSEGDTVTLTRELPPNGPTVLTEHRWEKKLAGSDEWIVIEGETGASLSFAATSADAGAEYRITIMKPNGQVAYGPSPAVTLVVQ